MTDKREITRLEWALYADIRQLDRFYYLPPALDREKVLAIIGELKRALIKADGASTFSEGRAVFVKAVKDIEELLKQMEGIE